MKLLIKGGALVLKDGEVKADLLIENGKITKIAPAIDEKCKVINASGKHVIPVLSICTCICASRDSRAKRI